MPLVDAATAARSIRRPVSTVYGWAQSGRIKRHGKDARGRWVYDLSEVADCARTSTPHSDASPGPRCTIERRDGDICDAPGWESSRYPVCERHALEVYREVSAVMAAIEGNGCARVVHD